MIEYFLVAIFFWLIVLTFIIFKTKKHYQNLVASTRKEKLDEILDQLISNDNKFSKEIELINNQLVKINEEAKFYLQKIGFVRYNPFEGRGEQSFVVALLDKENSGLVVNFIYTRDGLRVYTKQVKKGQGDKYELSEEEKNAIEKSNIKN
jgi:cell division protein FtsB